jgi:hypothetical protein
MLSGDGLQTRPRAGHERIRNSAIMDVSPRFETTTADQLTPALYRWAARRSDLHLFSDSKRVVNLDAEIPNRTFNPRVAKQKLDRPQVTFAAIDQGRLRSAERVGAERVRIEPNARNSFRDEPRILARRHRLSGPPPAGEQELAGLLVGSLQVAIDGLAGLLRQFESDRVAGLFLAHRRAGDRIAIRGNVFDPYCGDVAAPELAVDG